MRLPGRQAILALLMGAASVPCLADSCAFTLHVPAARNETEIDQRILRDTTARLGWCLVWDARETNITRRLAMLLNGEVDLVYDASWTEDRASQYRFSDKYRDETILLYVRRDDVARFESIHSFDDLLATKAALLTLRNAWVGPDYAQHREELLASHRTNEVERIAQGRGMLLMHHADVFIAPDTFGDFLQEQKESGIVALDWAAYRAGVYYMFSRKTVSADQVQQFNRALGKVLRRMNKS